MSFFMAYKFHVFVTVYYYFYGLSPRQEVITTTENEYSNVFHHGYVGLRTVNIRNSSFFIQIPNTVMCKRVYVDVSKGLD